MSTGLLAFSAILTVVALLGVALLILLFERKRARQIERDLGDLPDDRSGGSRPPGDEP